MCSEFLWDAPKQTDVCGLLKTHPSANIQEEWPAGMRSAAPRCLRCTARCSSCIKTFCPRYLRPSASRPSARLRCIRILTKHVPALAVVASAHRSLVRAPVPKSLLLLVSQNSRRCCLLNCSKECSRQYGYTRTFLRVTQERRAFRRSRVRAPERSAFRRSHTQHHARSIRALLHHARNIMPLVTPRLQPIATPPASRRRRLQSPQAGRLQSPQATQEGLQSEGRDLPIPACGPTKR